MPDSVSCIQAQHQAMLKPDISGQLQTASSSCRSVAVRHAIICAVERQWNRVSHTAEAFDGFFLWLVPCFPSMFATEIACDAHHVPVAPQWHGSHCTLVVSEF